MDKINQFLIEHPRYEYLRYALTTRYNSIMEIYNDREYCDTIFKTVFKDLLNYGELIW